MKPHLALLGTLALTLLCAASDELAIKTHGSEQLRLSKGDQSVAYSCKDRAAAGGLRIAWLTWKNDNGIPNPSQQIRGRLIARAAAKHCAEVAAAGVIMFETLKPKTSEHELRPQGFEELEQFAKDHGGIDLCVEVKFMYPERQKKCRELGAKIFVDVIDNEPFLKWATSLHPEKHWVVADSKLETLRKDDLYVVTQTEHLQRHLQEHGVQAVVIPHHHTNMGQWGVKPVRHREPDQPLNVVFLASDATAGHVGAEIRSAVCAGGGVLTVVNQKNRLHGKQAFLKSIVETYPCDGGPPKRNEKTTQSTNEETDILHQNLYFYDEASVDADIAVVWPASKADWFMERPATRMLYWWSRGIPTIHSQLFSYLEITKKEGYGACLGHSLEAPDARSLTKLVQELHSEEVRAALREEVIEGAKKYSVTATAGKFIMEIAKILGAPPSAGCDDPDRCQTSEEAPRAPQNPITQQLLKHLNESSLAFREPERYSELYQQGKPFPHISLDGMFPDDILKKIVPPDGGGEFPEAWAEKLLTGAGALKQSAKEVCRSAQEILPGWRCNSDAKWGFLKFGNSIESSMGPYLQGLMGLFKSPEWIRFLERLTGISPLLSDPTNFGGGLHQITRGGSLQIHSDFRQHPDNQLERRVNMFVYLNGDWKDEYAGHLELWSKDMSKCEQRISPDLGKLVIFSTHDFSYHGHADPLNTPPHRTRRSIAQYFYSPSARPPGQIDRRHPASHSTLYQTRNCETCAKDTCQNFPNCSELGICGGSPSDG